MLGGEGEVRALSWREEVVLLEGVEIVGLRVEWLAGMVHGRRVKLWILLWVLLLHLRI